MDKENPISDHPPTAKPGAVTDGSTSLLLAADQLVEMLATQKAAKDRVQGLLDALYPGLKAEFTYNGMNIVGPIVQLDRLHKAYVAFEDKKKGA